jgi:hypothetical protein
MIQILINMQDTKKGTTAKRHKGATGQSAKDISVL